MNKTEMLDLIAQKINLAQKKKIDYEEFFVNDVKDHYKHEFLFFIKPEITVKSKEIHLKVILDLAINKMNKYGLIIRDARILSARYLEKYNIMAQHYGVINALCSHAKKFLSDQAAEKFKAVTGKNVDDVKLLGGFELLAHDPSFNPITLDDLWQKSKIVKLAPGTYCAQVNINQEQLYLVNGFHPRQLTHYTDNGRSIVAFTLAGNLNWTIARNDFIGKTNPVEASPGSLRNDLYLNKEAYGLQTVSSGWNGFHLSAGPVEGLVELIRYNSNHLTGQMKNAGDFVFGKILLEHFEPKQIESILANSMVRYKETRMSVFDFTEEKNNDEALQLLKQSAADL